MFLFLVFVSQQNKSGRQKDSKNSGDDDDGDDENKDHYIGSEADKIKHNHEWSNNNNDDNSAPEPTNTCKNIKKG